MLWVVIVWFCNIETIKEEFYVNKFMAGVTRKFLGNLHAPGKNQEPPGNGKVNKQTIFIKMKKV